MVITELELHNFRNYKSLNLELSKSINVIYGKNGYGKTNLLEAMFLCCIGKSFRAAKDPEMIGYGGESFSVKTGIAENSCSSIRVTYNRAKSKFVEIDGVYVEKLRYLFGNLLGIVFSPESIRTVTDGPDFRRRFLNIYICQLSRDYYYSLMMYNKFCEEKNKILIERSRPDPIEFEVLNENIASYGAKIAYDRMRFVDEVNKTAARIYRYITDDTEDLTVGYVPNIPSLLDEIRKTSGETEDAGNAVQPPEDEKRAEIERIKGVFFADLTSERLVKREFEYGRSVIGTQKDDLDISFNGMNLRSFGSQGQKRSAAIALTLAVLEIMKKSTGRTPVLFLDDVLSELDDRRQRNIAELTKEYQTFYTCAKSDIMRNIGADGTPVNYINVEKLR